MKVVLARGNYSPCPKAYKRIAELLGIECHFYDIHEEEDLNNDYEFHFCTPVTTDEPETQWWIASPLTDASKVADLFNLEPDELDKNVMYRIPDFEDDRTNPILIQVIEEMGNDFLNHINHFRYGQIKIVEIPDDVQWDIDCNGGDEVIVERHRRWRFNDFETQ